ncbi:MAG: phosphotransferase, partial [Thermomicrobiales bacterium]|nr:phosphotransferase [Thermomicrobiales bacterium]
ILPAAQPRLDRIVGLLENRLARIDDELAIGHGDFYDDQAIVGDDGIALIDLDEIRIAHPMLDVGNMLAHLNFNETRGLVGRNAREAFIAGMRERRNMDERDIAVFEAAGLLKLAPGPFRRLEPNWRAGVADILDLTAQALDRAASPRSPVALAIDPDAAPVRDDALPELLALQDPTPMQRALRAATGNSALMLAGIRLQRHKPGRRAVLRYDMVGDDAIWGKIFASNRGTRVHEIARAICAARAFGPDVALPDPIAFLPELRVLLQRSAPGEAIDARLCAGDERLADAIAVAIHALHASGLDLGRVHDLASELAPLGPRVREVGACHPWLENSARELHARVLAAAGSLRGWRRVAIHRDFYHGQALVDGERLAILDLDDAAMSEPAVDIANFAAHLDLLALQRPDHAGDIARVRDRFLARSRELDPDLDGSMLAVLTAGTMLRLAGIHAPREDGARIAAGLLARGARVASTAAA